MISFGVHVAFHEARKAAEVIAQFLQSTTAHLANPLAFAYFVHERYVEDFRDMFAGRVYGEQPYAGLQALRALNAKNHPAASLAHPS